MRFRLAHLLPVFAFCCATASEAATYCVRNGGSDSADGRSHATAWASLDKVNSHSFSPGDQVLLLEGDRWVGALDVDWAGTSTAQAVVGAYYLEGSTPKRGYRSTRPIIDGDDRLPSSNYASLVNVRANRVRVENLTVRNSEGRGISVAQVSDAEIVGCSVSNIYRGGIHILKSQRTRAENNLVSRSDIGLTQDLTNWGAAIAIVSSTSTVIRNNTVSEVWGEGINAHSGSQYTLIEHNYVFGARSAGVYSDASPDTTIRRNIIVGTANSTWWRVGNTVGAGIALNNEAYHYPVGGGSQDVNIQSKRAKIYGNLVAYTNAGVAIWGSGLPETSYDGLLIYNNTFVDNTVQITMNSKPKPGAQFVNNILLSVSGGTIDVEGFNLNGMTAKNNYFSQGDPGGAYSHTGNRYTGLKLAKMSGWQAVNNRDQISWRDFVVLSGSPVIGSGSDEPWRVATGEQDYRLDHNKAEFSLPMDMGGLTFATPPGPRPMAPTQLSGT
jgi:parallel beta-helix repeat protein